MKIHFLLLILTLPCLILSTTRTVSLDGTQQYTSIQTAVNASASGDTVLVYPGRYLENISIIQKSNISVISLEATSGNPTYIESTIIDGQAISWGMWIRQSSQNITIRGFSITNCKTGLSISENSIATIRNCNIYGNKARLGAGFGASASTVYLSGVNIHDNYAYNMGGGVYINGFTGTVNVTFDPVNRCSIYNNTAGYGQDIVAQDISSDLSIPLDMFSVNNITSYYALSRSSGFEYQLLINHLSTHHQEINNDLFVSPDGDDSNDGLSPATALKTIKIAIYRIASDSLNPKTVHLLSGTYSRTANQQIFPISLKPHVNVVGAGIDETQIVGQQDPAFPDVLYNPLIVFTTFYQNNVSLESMSITSENSTNNCALYGRKEDSTRMVNLRMYNLAPKDYAVVQFYISTNNIWDNVIIEDIITNEKGLVCNQGGYFTGTIRNCIFRNATSIFSSTEVWAAPLIWLTLGQSVRIENSIFSNLSMLDDDSQTISIGGEEDPDYVPHYTVQNCLFSNLDCSERGTILHGNNYPVMNIANCTFAGQNGNGEALMVNGIVNISNCIFYNNRSKEIAINPMDGSGITTTLTLNNNLIRNGFNDIWQAPGNTINYTDTNITGNPLFLGGDDINNPFYYSLSEYSPCINTGTADTTGLNLLPYDLAGNQRVWDGRIDMGCYEFGAPPVANDDPTTPALQNGLLSAYPNPLTAFTNLKVVLPSNQDNSQQRVTTASIDIYNIKGQKVKSISLDPSKVGEQFTYWDGRDVNGRQCSSGIYFLHMSVNGKRCLSKKVTLFR